MKSNDFDSKKKFKFLKLISVVVCTVVACVFFASCNSETGGKSDAEITDSENDDENVRADLPEVDFDVEIKKGNYDTSADNITIIELDDDNTAVSGEGAYYSENILTVESEGIYVIEGNLSDGRIVVDTEDTGKVVIVFNGAGVVSSSGPAVLVVSAPKKVVFYSAEESVNAFIDGNDYIVPDEEQTEDGLYPNACIYSADDIEFDGKGDIYITSNIGKGINTKDDLKISGGNIYICAADDGMRGNDSVEITGGYLSISAGADGIKSSNAEKEGKGYVLITGGEVYVASAYDGIQAQTDLTVSGGMITIKCADGVDASKTGSGSQFGTDSRRPGGMAGGFNEGNANKPDYSCKALKSETNLNISGGTIYAETPDDAVHSKGIVYLTGGSISALSGDDGIHADSEVVIDGGEILVLNSYEGIEAVNITVNGGYINITSSDDGFNACGGSSSIGGPGGNRPGGPGMLDNSYENDGDSSGEEPMLAFNGGTVIVNASGDGIDSNGNINMNGGTVIVYGPTNSGNGAIDYGDGNYNMTISGGTLLAVGASGMAETALGNGQGVLAFSCGNISADVCMTITDENGNEIITFAAPKMYQTIVFSSDEVESGGLYKVYINTTHTGQSSDGIYSGGEYSEGEELGSLRAD